MSAPTPRTLPANYPQPLGTQMLRADFQRQFSMLRQEIVSDLLGVLTEAYEPAIRAQVLKLIENHLRSGLAAARKAEDLWPDLEDARETISGTELKPAVQRRHLKLFEQFDRVQRRSWPLLNDSFANVRLILDRVPNAERAESRTSSAPQGIGHRK